MQDRNKVSKLHERLIWAINACRRKVPNEHWTFNYATFTNSPTHMLPSAVLIGGWQLTTPNGTNIHRYIGYACIGLMLIVSITSFWIHTIKQFGDFSPIRFLSIFTHWFIYSAITAVRRHDKKISRDDEASLCTCTYSHSCLYTPPGRKMHQVIFG